MNKTSRIATATLATALGAGAVIAGAAPQAQATSVWDRVAACESGNNWSINTGNGFYGGLQFTHSTWIAYGGGAYANNANGATRAQQIAIAQKVLASQGAGAWPVCSVRAGLTRSNGGSSSASTTTATTSSTTTYRAATTTTTKTSTSSTTAKKVTATKVSTTARGTYRVKSGDTLAKIARAHGESWQQLWAKNKSTIKNPNMIRVGQLVKY